MTRKCSPFEYSLSNCPVISTQALDDQQKSSMQCHTLPCKATGSNKLKTFVHDPCSNQPSYEGSRLTMAKITNKDNICSLNSVAKLEVISY